MKQILKSVLDGLLISLPIIVVLVLVSLIFELLTELLSPLISIITPLLNIPEFISTWLALALLLLIFFAIGVLVRKSHGQNLIRRLEENYLNGIPLYSSISSIVKHFAGLKSMPFRQVVLVDPFDTGTMLTGFVTEKVSNNMYTIFVPTAPNPTNGNIYHVPFERLKFLDVTAEEAMKTVVGVGSGSSVLFCDSDVEEKVLSNGAAINPQSPRF